jgi:hypothetical protein
MSLGNGNAKASNKGSNFSHELKTLKVLNAISASAGAGATEATLLALLAAVEATRDYEVRIVNDSNPGGEVTFLEVRYWDAQDGTLGSPVYFLPGDNTPYAVGDPGGPVAPLSYVPTSTLLSEIVAQLQAVNDELDAIKVDTESIEINTDNLDVALSTRATEATLALVKGVLDNIDANTDGIEALLTTIDAVLDDIKLDTISINSYLATIDTELQDQGVTLDSILVDTGEIETELLDQGTTLDSIETELQSVDDRLTAKTITPNLVRATGAGTIAPAVYSFSVANVGAADGSITIGANPAVAIKPTESFTFDAGSLNNQYAAGTIAYNGSGTELVIIFNS